MSAFTLTQDQQAAYNAFVAFITNPYEPVFVLAGYAGTGKSTLVKQLLKDLPATLQTAKLIIQSDIDWDIHLTATTNKAAEALAKITDKEVRTIQSFLGLRVSTDYKTKKTTLVPHNSEHIQKNCIIFIDEFNLIDHKLLKLIFAMTDSCKLVFIGDPAQVAPVNSNPARLIDAGYPQAKLTQVVRQPEGSPIIDLATGFRNTVYGAPWPQVIPDGKHIIRLPRGDFEGEIIQEYSRPAWQHDDSKVLAWTNKHVIYFSQGIRSVVKGMPELQVGDYAVCNHYISSKSGSIKTDETVMISGIADAAEHGVNGWLVEMNHKHRAFLPRSLEDKKAKIKQANAKEDWKLVQHIDTRWIDLRADYACTINKSQGSTYDRVFIDLDDVKRCNSANNLARLMYVGVSRARHQVYLTGDLV
jgi:Schitoviridae ATP-dependent RecD-like DNA helicase